MLRVKSVLEPLGANLTVTVKLPMCEISNGVTTSCACEVGVTCTIVG